MARILMRREAFESGQFPPVCCKTGLHGDVYSAWEFSHTPSWIYILILFGIFPFLIASYFATRRFSGVLPLSAGTQQRLRTARRLVWIFGLGGIGLALTGLALAEPLITGVSTVVLAAWLITIVCVWIWSPGARLEDERVVELVRVHPSFVEAIVAAHQQTQPPPTTEA
jgi:hypothetical protein